MSLRAITLEGQLPEEAVAPTCRLLLVNPRGDKRSVTLPGAAPPATFTWQVGNGGVQTYVPLDMQNTDGEWLYRLGGTQFRHAGSYMTTGEIVLDSTVGGPAFSTGYFTTGDE